LCREYGQDSQCGKRHHVKDHVQRIQPDAWIRCANSLHVIDVPKGIQSCKAKNSTWKH